MANYKGEDHTKAFVCFGGAKLFRMLQILKIVL